MYRAFWLVALLLVGCGSPSELDDRWADPTRVEFAEALKVDLSQMTRTASGLYLVDLEPGEGDTVKVGDQVRVHYTAWLPDGTQVYTTRDDAPIQFALGYSTQIPGLDEGVVGMRVGSTRRLVIRPELAYGRFGNPDLGIPPLTTLVCEVERRPTLAM